MFEVPSAPLRPRGPVTLIALLLPTALSAACAPSEDPSQNTSAQALTTAIPLVSQHAVLAEPAEEAPASAGLSASRSRPTDPLFARALGRWVGSCDILVPGRAEPVQSVEMERITEPTDDPGTYTWTLIYRTPAGEQVRPYVMSADPARPGRYLLDEGGLILTNYLIGDVLYSDFDVPGARLLSRDDIRGNRYQFEIQISGTNPELVNDLGGGFLVNAYRMNSIQRCSLRRVGRGHDHGHGHDD